jgi:hypothetical protein
MKKSLAITLFMFALGLGGAVSQSINNIPLKDLDAEYIRITGTYRFLTTQMNIEVDYGQEISLRAINDKYLKDENGNVMVFYSMIGALNFFSRNGYELVNAFPLSANEPNIHHYILRKKIREKESEDIQQY